MSKVLGMNAKLYYDTTLLTDDDGVAYSAATWLELTNVADNTLNLETGEADTTTRGNNGWRSTLATLKDGSIEFEMIWDNADAGFTALKDAWLASSEIAIACLDGDEETSGSQGLAGNFSVTNFSRNEALEEAVRVSVTLKPSSFNNWWVVGET